MKDKACAMAITVALVGLLAWKAAADIPAFFGDPFSGLATALLDRFNAGKDEFEEEDGVDEGLGPVFNDTSCAACHLNPSTGGDSDVVETRFGTITDNHFDPLAQLGGSLIQSQGVGPLGSCNFGGESVPAEATIVAGRKTTPLFGLGLVDAVPDKVYQLLATLQRNVSPSTAGRVNIVQDATTGRPAVGKFGWKAQVPSLAHFSGDAYLNEMGITSPFFPNENCPQGDCALITTCDPATEPDNDGTAVQAFTDFMTFLAPPPRGPITRQVLAGERVFLRIGCANCHLPTFVTGPNPVRALNKVTFHPYSDFLLHDMGELGDGIEQSNAKGRDMRTAPLWGLRVRNTFLHDGSQGTPEGAILAHAGQGLASRNRFNTLGATEAAALIEFLRSL
jgi:CxxC motif-containing protein (DUF1111 family)